MSPASLLLWDDRCGFAIHREACCTRVVRWSLGELCCCCRSGALFRVCCCVCPCLHLSVSVALRLQDKILRNLRTSDIINMYLLYIYTYYTHFEVCTWVRKLPNKSSAYFRKERISRRSLGLNTSTHRRVRPGRHAHGPGSSSASCCCNGSVG